MKGKPMKDKITVVLVCAFFIGMVWISSISNTTFSNNPVISEEIISTPAKDITREFIDYDVSESVQLNEISVQTEIATKNTCTLESITTDALTFNEAFGYYRQCRGDDSSFQWKGMEYTTLLSEEVIIHMADSVKAKSNSEEEEISQIR